MVSAQGLPFWQFEHRDFVVRGDKVVVFGYERALAKPTNRTFETDWVMVLTMRAGHVVRFRAYHDKPPW